ncbi:MAG: queuosine precursor transporter [Planctomycetota bacterium]|nr:queuosine precursor transporter [Planctomycetota bacterium]
MPAQKTPYSLHPIEASQLHARRERVFLIFAGLFLGSLTMLNILGITRFIKLASFTTDSGLELTFAVAVGVLPYPITFLCTDFISEFYGRKRANWVVFVGLGLNIWVVFILWLGGVLPGFELTNPETGEIVRDAADRMPLFFEVRSLTFGAVAASMVAYLMAQFCDVYLFHFLKRLTNGKMLWLRNNGSTLISQLVDSIAVIFITYWVGGLAGIIDTDRNTVNQLLLLIITGYAFKLVIALFDTIPFYVGVHYLSTYLQIDPTREHEADGEASQEDHTT